MSAQYFIACYFSLEHIPYRGHFKWQSLKFISAKLACKCCEVWQSLICFRLWYPELASLRERYFALFSFGKYHYVHPLWTGLKSVWFSITRPRHNLTLSIGLSTNMKLLDHSAASSRQSNVMMSCCCSYSNSSLDGFCRK